MSVFVVLASGVVSCDVAWHRGRHHDLAAGALETFGSNLSNNIWYFYMPVVYNGDYLGDRIGELTSRGGINNTVFEDL